VRTLPLRLTPVEGESLPGYIARYAHACQFPPGDTITAIGLVDRDKAVAGAGRYWVTLSPDQLMRAAFATGITERALERMLLSRYAGRAFEMTATRVMLAEAPQAHEVLTRSSKFCSQCLAEDGAWLLRWQLGWTAVCTRHRALLIRSCPRCGTVPRHALRSRWPRDDIGVLSDPIRCARRADHALCRTDLATAEPWIVTDDAVEAQRRIDDVLDHGLCPPLAGELLEPLVYLRCVHGLCKLLAYHPRQPSLPPVRPHVASRVLDDPGAVASVLPEALALADLNRRALIDAVREHVEHRYQHDRATLRIDKLRDTPNPVRDAVRRALSEAAWSPPLTRLGLHRRAHRRPDDLDPRLQARHVPQLFWDDDYEREIAGLFAFDDFTHWHGRRFCSLLLARMITPLDWDAAVRALDYPETFINKGYNTTSVKLRANGCLDELIARVKTIANRYAVDEPVDYQHRRRLLADWPGVNREIWLLLQSRSRQTRWGIDAPSRMIRASVWLWCDLTSGHERAAPISLPTTNLAHQTEFIRDALPDLRGRLMILGQELLTTSAGDHNALAARFEATLHDRGLVIVPAWLTRREQLKTREPRERSKPPRVPPTIADGVLSHVAAHTGVDIPAITTTWYPAMHTPPAVIHARLLAAALLKQTFPTSWNAIGEAINQTGLRLAGEQRAYQAARGREPRLAEELDQLQHAIEQPRTAVPEVPTRPHQQRMSDVAQQIHTRATELLTASHGAHIAIRASIAACRQHTDLTCPAIAAIHGITNAQPALARAVVARYIQLLEHAAHAQCAAGFANANLTRALARKAHARQRSNYMSQTQLR
jgi:hypothetical protein